MIVKCIWEHNNDDTLLYATELIGAYARGESLDVAIAKMHDEVKAYLTWSGQAIPEKIAITVTGEKSSNLNIRDADSDVIFENEKEPLTENEYVLLKELALKSAKDFITLYLSIPNKSATCLPARKTFYGNVPRTADEMYQHTKNVNEYYFGEIDVNAENVGDIYECRKIGFDMLESNPDFLKNAVMNGSYGEEWSTRKVIRRFIWHDRIHARAMYRMAVKLFGAKNIADPFYFNLE